jgi:predicted alpha/beta superfamily hydrolase
MAQPKVCAGKIVRLDSFPSLNVAARNVDIWLPPNYDEHKKYPVLYMHDGQMLFDSTTTWNKQEWQIDEVATNLIKQKKLRPFIVVGVWNNGKYRHAEYYPEQALNYLSDSTKQQLIQKDLMGKPLADAYLKFLVEELKPYVDKHFATLPNKANTFIAGSSMGGLISMYAICQYPKVFSVAACISTHWIGSINFKGTELPNAFMQYLKNQLPAPQNHAIYFDYGTVTLDSLYPAWQAKADVIMKAKGYTKKNWITKAFVGEAHTEVAWAKRLDIPLLFLLKQ